MVRSHPTVVTLEEGQVSNGFGAYMAREIADLELETSPRIGTLGVPDRFIQHGGREELLVEIGLDVAGISAQVRNIVARGVTLEPV
jgi:1-deoxy-D-xylulose-5-phosphate synthase